MKMLAFCLLAPLAVSTAQAGRIVINHDEWTLSNSGYAAAGAANTGQFVRNVADFMNIGGGSGNFLVYSTNFGVTQSAFLTELTTAGHTVVVNPGIAFTLANLSAFDGVFLGGAPLSKDDTVMTAYVNAGGSIYIAAGTGVGGAAGEAARWNGFLTPFGLQFGSVYNGCCGNDPVGGTHPILAGVAQLYYDNGNTVSTTGGNPDAQVIELSAAGVGLLGVYDDVDAVVPEASSAGLVAAGAAALALLRQVRRK